MTLFGPADEEYQIICKSEISSSEKLVLTYLLNCRNKDTGLCCPSLNAISDATSLSTRTLTRTLTKLKENGFVLYISGTGNSSTRYLLLIKDRIKKKKTSRVGEISAKTPCCQNV